MATNASSGADGLLARPIYGAAVGALLGVLIVLAISLSDIRITRVPDQVIPIQTSAAAAAAFVGSYTAMTESSWAVDSTFSRTLTDGRHFDAAQREAQRLPDHVRETFGSTELYVGGRRYACGTAPNADGPVCRDAGAADYNAQIRADLLAVRTLVTGPQPTYDVQQEANNCFSLFARPTTAVLQWGTRARFCFDRATKGVSRSEFDRDGGTDVVQSTSIRPPRDDDFKVPTEESS